MVGAFLLSRFKDADSPPSAICFHPISSDGCLLREYSSWLYSISLHGMFVPALFDSLFGAIAFTHDA